MLKQKIITRIRSIISIYRSSSSSHNFLDQIHIDFPTCAQGVWLKLCAENRVGLLSDITRVLRENGLAVVRADIATKGKKAVNAFYVRDISGNEVDMGFIKSMKKEMGLIDLEVKNDNKMRRKNISSHERHRFSLGDLLKSQLERFSHNFIAIN